jgi:predicted AAA+ superfamily ATPase
MIRRDFWLSRIEKAWESVPVVWLSGVRRVGKTTLARQIPEALFLNCDLPSTLRQLEDPERFLASVDARVVVFDEIHRLDDPSRLLKIAADEHSHLRVLATGSSSLAATLKFKDSLTGRKRHVHLLPVLYRELDAFHTRNLEKRLLQGGLPEPLLAESKDPEFFAEWLASYFSRDVQELFRVGKRREFLLLVNCLLRASGGMLEVNSLAKHCRLSRQTVMSYLEALQVTHVVTLINPYHGGGRQELLRQPKAYAFDTGFVTFARGWDSLRAEDRGDLWEHVVLETLLSHHGIDRIRYWRDKRKREVDFVVAGGRGQCDAVECKWSPGAFSPRGLAAFRNLHPVGANYMVSPQLEPPRLKRAADLDVVFTNLDDLVSGEARRVLER